MSEQRIILEMGTGNDLYGMDYTKAACRAVQDAIYHSSLTFIRSLGLDSKKMKVMVTIGVQKPDQVNVDAVKACLPHGDVSVSVCLGGLDVPNANTIFINNANNFGLSDLHQMRGRVGRSNKKAFCYLLAPPLHLNTPEARRRLKAIEEFSEYFNEKLEDAGNGMNLKFNMEEAISDYEKYKV